MQVRAVWQQAAELYCPANVHQEGSERALSSWAVQGVHRSAAKRYAKTVLPELVIYYEVRNFGKVSVTKFSGP